MIKPYYLPRFRSHLVAVGITSLFSAAAVASDLYFDPAAASGSNWLDSLWGTSDSGPFTGAWDSGSTAIFDVDSARTYNINGDLVVGGIQSEDLGVTFTGTGGVRTLDLSGAELSSSATGSDFSISFSDNLAIVGDFTLVLGGLDLFGLTSNSTLTGTVTSNTDSQVRIGPFNTAGTQMVNANFVVNGGLIRTGAGTKSLGALTIDSGTFDYGSAAADPTSVTVTSLSGSGGVLQPRTGATTAVHTFTVNQTADTIFSGNVNGVNNARGTTFVKSESGELVLNGDIINLRDGTQVNGGSLLINGAGTRNFEHRGDDWAITVGDTGILGGTSTLTIFGGDDVVVQNGGGLSAGGAVGSVGALTFSFDDGGSLILDDGTLNLVFDLGADTTGGVSYDQVRVIDGTLNIGAGLLDFNDFTFNALAGFGEGTYTLFELTGSTLSGELGSELAGIVGDYIATLGTSGDNIILSVTVIPEPRQVALMFAVAVLLVTVVRRRRT